MRVGWLLGVLASGAAATACAGLFGIDELNDGNDAGALVDSSAVDGTLGKGVVSEDAGLPIDSSAVDGALGKGAVSEDAGAVHSDDASPFVCPGYDAALIPWGADAGEAGTGLGGPPSLPIGTPPTTTTTKRNFALHHIHLGDEEDPVYGYSGWKAYGYNIDGLDTTDPSASNSCTPNPNPANVEDQVDGPDGLDNSFGANLTGPLLSLFASSPSGTLDYMLGSGQFTFLMDVTGLSGAPGQTASGLSGALFAGLIQGGVAPIEFTTDENWPISSASVQSPILNGGVLAQPICATTHLPGAYVMNGTFVSGTLEDVQLGFSFIGASITLPIEHAIITFRSPGDAGATQATGGIIAGVINTQKLIAAFEPLFAFTSACTSVPSIAPVIEQAADILDDGTNAPGTPCTAVSIGIGFDADEIAQPTIAQTPPSSPGCDSGTAPSDAGGAGN